MMEYYASIKKSVQSTLGLVFVEDYISSPSNGQLWKLVKENKVKTIKDLLQRGCIKIDDIILERVNHTLLCEAVVQNKMEIFRLAMLYNPNVNFKDGTKTPVLMKAIILNRREMVKQMLDRGADPYATDDLGRTCIQKAEFFENFDILDDIIQSLENKEKK